MKTHCDCGEKVVVELSDMGFYITAYCGECDKSFDAREFMTIEEQQFYAQLGVAPCSPLYMRPMLYDAETGEPLVKRGE